MQNCRKVFPLVSRPVAKQVIYSALASQPVAHQQNSCVLIPKGRDRLCLTVYPTELVYVVQKIAPLREKKTPCISVMLRGTLRHNNISKIRLPKSPPISPKFCILAIVKKIIRFYARPKYLSTPKQS